MKMLENPFYAGVYLHGDQVEQLGTGYDFSPMITPEEYLLINSRTGTKSDKLKRVLKFMKREGVKADLLRGCVFCAGCNYKMYSGISSTKKKGKVSYRYYYRCQNAGCENEDASVRPKIILDYVCDYLAKTFNPTNEAWLHYKIEAKKDFELLQSKLIGDLARMTQRQTQLLNTNNDLRLELMRLAREENNPLRIDYENDYEKNTEELRVLEVEIAKYKEKTKEKLKILDKNKFLEVMQKLPVFIRDCPDMKTLDEVLRKIFSNFTINQKEVIKSTLNSPFDLVFGTNVPTSARGGTRTHTTCVKGF
jgi:hypothetical protein